MVLQAHELHAIFRRNMKARREELGLSQLELARITGIQQPQLSELERGGTNPTLATLARIAEALDLSPSALISASFYHSQENSIMSS
jgi:transcriptional regulator with XRE-family HTH domain